MIALLIVSAIAVALFGCVIWSEARVTIERERLVNYKRVGQWYEERVAALEKENENLAYQVISGGGKAVSPGLIPEKDPYAGKEFAYDETGLVREVLDPRDLPYE